jgi:hypothetical protein
MERIKRELQNEKEKETSTRIRKPGADEALRAKRTKVGKMSRIKSLRDHERKKNAEKIIGFYKKNFNGLTKCHLGELGRGVGGGQESNQCLCFVWFGLVWFTLGSLTIRSQGTDQ